MKQNPVIKQLEIFYKIISHILNARTPHTMEHVQRVPILANMIAKAVSLNQKQKFNEDDFYKIDVAAKLHDCGKTTTADYLLEKSTKMESLRNRIHEIRNRFEILRRDAEIKYLKEIIAHPENKKEAEKFFKKTLKTLNQDFQFIADCNLGENAVKEEEIKRLKKIGRQKFKRNFSRLLGLSWYEKTRIAPENMKKYAKPGMETILQDNPEDNYKNIPTGELYNLSTFKGTINPTERKKIEQHALETENILNLLELPKEYKDIVTYASQHHEQLCGKGYPHGLSDKKIPIPSRIINIADIFEALTTSGRPYKSPKKLSEALYILQTMKNKQQIDADIYKLCIQKKVFIKYAQKYVDPQQIDTTDLEKFL